MRDFVRSVALGFTLCVAISGCALPYVSERVPPSDYDRDIDLQTRLHLEVGKTTRKDVLVALGGPDEVLDNEHVFIYEAKTTEGAWLWNLLIIFAVPGGGGAWKGPIGAEGAEFWGRRLVINFDNAGVVTSYDIGDFRQTNKRTERWQFGL